MAKKFVNSFKDKLLRYIHKSIYKPGHYYSAVPDPVDIEKRAKQLYRVRNEIGGVNINETEQLNFLTDATSSIGAFPYFNRENSFRYKLPNNFFGMGDTLALYIIFKSIIPKQVIEIGSGYSSAAMLDYNDLFFKSEIKFDFIEPYPERLNSLLTGKDKGMAMVHTKFVQDVPLDFFRKLNENDVLFIDSSHVSKIGSDVNYLFFEVLPILKKGVVIHIHDIAFPFEYSKDWIDYGIYWNEAYLLRAFLSYNSSFEILLWNDFLKDKKNAEITAINPLYSRLGGGSIWLRKMVD
jgi:hypothetical protein